MLEKYYSEKLESCNKLIEEIKIDKSALLKDKENHLKEIEELRKTKKEQEEKISDLGSRSQMHHGNF